MKQSQKDRIIAGVGTAVFHIIIAAILLLVYLHYSGEAEERRWPPEDTSEIVFGGEYVMLGDIQQEVAQTDNTPAPAEAVNAPSHSGQDMTNEGLPSDEAAPLTTSQQESPMKEQAKPKPAPTGPTKEELAERERVKREKERAEKQSKINDRLKSGFSGKKGSGKTGSPNGNSTTGAVSGMPGHNLKGRTAESWGRPSSTLSGTIRIRVSVNRQGRVVGNPTYVGGSGPAAANSATRRSCIEASRNSRFSVDLDAQAEQVGIITWNFE